MYITRHMEHLLEQITTQYPVLLVTGPRQVGKTTMLEHLAQKEGRGRETVTLDDLTIRELAKTDPKMFFCCFHKVCIRAFLMCLLLWMKQQSLFINDIQHLIGVLRIQGTRGLIQQKKPGLCSHCPCNCYPLLLSSGQCAWFFPSIRTKAKAFQKFFCTPNSLLSVIAMDFL